MARKLKVELVIDANKKTCGKCKYRKCGGCFLFDLSLELVRSGDYQRLKQCIDAEANNHG